MNPSLTDLVAFVALWSIGGWIWSRAAGRMDVADVLWGPGIAVLATLIMNPWDGSNVPSLIFLTALWLWATRLALHIWRRNARKPEDARYLAWRENWGAQVNYRSFVQVFLLQTALMVPMAAPAFAIRAHFNGFSIAHGLGIALFTVGFLIESVADRQLAAFKRHSGGKGMVLRTGLWTYSRHPNYFGEVLLWWGLGMMGGLVGLIAPATITWLILKVSGVPMLEKRWAADPKYSDYVNTVPTFWPWSSKTKAS